MSLTAASPAEKIEPIAARARPRLSSVIGKLAGANLAFVAVTMITAPLQARGARSEGTR